MKVYFSKSKEYGFTLESGTECELADGTITNLLKYYKYKIMWSLRSIEDKVNAAGGTIIISDNLDDPISVRGFSDEMRDEILELIKAEAEKET